jgi:hypothetical protein
MTSQAPVTALGLLFARSGGHGNEAEIQSGALFLAGLTGFPEDSLTFVFDPLALVGLRRSYGTNLSGFIAYDFFVCSRDKNLGVVLNREGDSLWRFYLDWMAVTGTHDESLSLDSCPVANTYDFKLSREPLGDPFNHVGHEGSAKAMALPGPPRSIGRINL